MPFYISPVDDEYLISENRFPSSELLQKNDLSYFKERGMVKKLRISGRSYVHRLETPKFDINGLFSIRSIYDNIVSLKLENIRLDLNETINEQSLPNLECLLLNTCCMTEA